MEQLEELKEYWKDFPEAPVSSTFRWVDANGFEHMTTFRAWGGKALLGTLAAFTNDILGVGAVAPSAHQPKATTQASDAKADWMRDGNGQPAIDKGKMIYLVDGGADALPDGFKIDCPLHSGKRLFLNNGKYGKFLGHKMDAGGYCNANIYEKAPEQETPQKESGDMPPEEF